MARSVPRDPSWDWIAHIVAEKLNTSMGQGYLWPRGHIGRVQLHPDILPLGGKDLPRVVQWLRDIADDIEDGNWETYLFPLERG